MSYLKEMAESGYSSDRIDPFHRHMIPWLCASKGVKPEDPVADIGAGHGHCLLPLHDAGFKALTALDKESDSFPLFEGKGIKTFLCDVSREALPLADAGTKLALCFHVIEHLQSPDFLLGEIKRILRPDGMVFFVTPDWRKQHKIFWRDPTHVKPYDKEGLGRLLRIHGFAPEISSWNAAYGFGRLRLYRWLPKLGLIGRDILGIGYKAQPAARFGA